MDSLRKARWRRLKPKSRGIPHFEDSVRNDVFGVGARREMTGWVRVGTGVETSASTDNVCYARLMSRQVGFRSSIRRTFF